MTTCYGVILISMTTSYGVVNDNVASYVAVNTNQHNVCGGGVG